MKFFTHNLSEKLKDIFFAHNLQLKTFELSAVLSQVMNGESCIIIHDGTDSITWDIIHWFIESVKNSHAYVYSDMTYMGDSSSIFEYLPQNILKEDIILNAEEKLLLPTNCFDMKYIKRIEIITPPKEIITKYIIEHSSKFQYPISINLELSAICNLKCIMCNYQTRLSPTVPQKPYFFPVEYAEKMASEFKANKIAPTIEFAFRGENLLNKNIAKIVDIFSNAGCFTTLFTNGLLLTPKISQQLLDAGLNRLSFSVDSLDEYTYQSIRVGSNLKKVIDNIKFVRALVNKSYPNVTLERRAVRQDKNFYEWDSFFDEMTDTFDIISSQNEVIMQNKKFISKNMFRYNNFSFCILPWLALSITSSGDVYQCGVTTTTDKEEILGNISNQSVLDIWDGQKHKQLQNYMLTNSEINPYQCKKCSKQPCSSGLVFQTYDNKRLIRTLEGVKYSQKINSSINTNFFNKLLNRLKGYINAYSK